MLIYHYTSEERLEAITSEGLNRGELPMSATETRNVVWLTTDRDSSGHGLTDGRAITDTEVDLLRRSGQPFLAYGARFPNKRAIRLTIKIPRDRIKQWFPWANRHMDDAWRRRLIESGGGLRKAKTWFFSREPIDPMNFVDIEWQASEGGSQYLRRTSFDDAA